MSLLTPSCEKNSCSSGAIYSALSIFATVFLAPSAFANTHEFMFLLSSGVTAMNKSAFSAPAFFSASMLVDDASIVRMSTSEPICEKRSSSVSITTMSSCSRESSRARWQPMAYAPDIMIFMFFYFDVEMLRC